MNFEVSGKVGLHWARCNVVIDHKKMLLFLPHRLCRRCAGHSVAREAAAAGAGVAAAAHRLLGPDRHLAAQASSGSAPGQCFSSVNGIPALPFETAYSEASAIHAAKVNPGRAQCSPLVSVCHCTFGSLPTYHLLSIALLLLILLLTLQCLHLLRHSLVHPP